MAGRNLFSRNKVFRGLVMQNELKKKSFFLAQEILSNSRFKLSHLLLLLLKVICKIIVLKSIRLSLF